MINNLEKFLNKQIKECNKLSKEYKIKTEQDWKCSDYKDMERYTHYKEAYQVVKAYVKNKK